MKYILVVALTTIWFSCVPVVTSTDSKDHQALEYEDINYSEDVKSVQITKMLSREVLTTPAIKLQNAGFGISFDLLEDDVSFLHAKLIHCNWDWTQSELSDLEFMTSYNEFPIESYEYSENTLISYVNYHFDIPNPFKSGNYLIVVYRNNDPFDLVLSRRVIVFDQQIAIQTEVKMGSDVSRRQQDQQIDFSFNYPTLNTMNPMVDFKVVLLQNHNWKNKRTDLKPSLMRYDESYLEYHPFDGSNVFSGLNEFRFFDLRSVDYRRMNVASIRKKSMGYDALLMSDKTRKFTAYTQQSQDLNGGYYLSNTDPGDSELQSEYVKVQFELVHDQIVDPVFIMGKINSWGMTDMNQMVYDTLRSRYVGELLLKQGYYNYAYWTKSDIDPYEFEGGHFQTRNEYEVLVYYRNPSNNFDELLGYQFVSGF